MGSKEFTISSGITGLLKWEDVNDEGNKCSRLLVNFYIKNSTGTDIFTTESSTFSAYVWGTQNILTGGIVSLPATNRFEKIGACISQLMQRDADGNRVIPLRVYGVLSGTPIVVDYTISSVSLGKLTESSSEFSTFSFNADSNQTAYLGDTIDLTITRKRTLPYHRITFYFGNIEESYNYFFDDNDERLKNSSTERFGPMASLTKDVKLKLPESLQSTLITQNKNACIVKLSTYNALGSLVGLPYCQRRIVNIPQKYFPVGNVACYKYNPKLDTLLAGYSGYKITAKPNHAVEGDQAHLAIKIDCKEVGAASLPITPVTTGEDVEFIINKFARAGTKQIIITTINSRGRSESVTYTPIVYDYFKPWYEVPQAYRCTIIDSEVDIDNKGSSLYVPSLAQHICNVGSNAFKSASVKIKEVNSESYFYTASIASGTTSLLLENVFPNAKKSYQIDFYIEDGIDSNVISTIILSSRVMIHFPPGGKSIGFGMYNYQEGTLKVGYDLYVKEQLVDYVVEDAQCSSSAAIGGTTEFPVDWKYKMWASGRAEAFGTCKFNDLDFSASSYKSFNLQFPKHNGSLVFTDIDFINSFGDYTVTLNINGGLTPGASSVNLNMVYNTATTIHPTVRFHIIGTWK